MNNDTKQPFTTPLLALSFFDQGDQNHTSGISELWNIRDISDYSE